MAAIQARDCRGSQRLQAAAEAGSRGSATATGQADARMAMHRCRQSSQATAARRRLSQTAVDARHVAWQACTLIAVCTHAGGGVIT